MHKRFRGCVAWSMVIIGSIVVAFYDFPTALMIVVIALVVWSILLGLSAEGFI